MSKMMADVCVDNRFELIAKYKAKLIEATNIETDKAEMDVIDNVLFRTWQMGWLDRLEQSEPLERRRGMNTTVTSDSTSYTSYCSSRLPCGICRLTMQTCPLWNGCGIHIMPTWGIDKTDITCSVDRKGEQE